MLMKFKRLWSCVLALAMMTTMVSFQASAYEGSTNDGGYTIDEPYEYPVVPGTEEWVALDTFEEKLKKETCRQKPKNSEEKVM